MDEICPDMLKALDIVGLSCCVAKVTGHASGQIGGPEGVLELLGNYAAQPPGQSLCQGPGKEAPHLGFRKSNADSVLSMEH